eukprot:jgi/Bigna1/79640/fgenesh1_pg.64_\
MAMAEMKKWKGTGDGGGHEKFTCLHQSSQAMCPRRRRHRRMAQARACQTRGNVAARWKKKQHQRRKCHLLAREVPESARKTPEVKNAEQLEQPRKHSVTWGRCGAQGDCPKVTCDKTGGCRTPKTSDDS